jgi:glycosyltransferase involved in cell wall biosynthesis
MSRLRILVHDLSGHPFQIQLSRELARRGHEVLHLYFESFPSPRGNVCRTASDPPNFTIEGLRFSHPFDKQNLIRRRIHEARYGRMVAQRISGFAPHVVISSNSPIDVERLIHTRCRQLGIPVVFWVQDIYSIAMRTLLGKRKIPFVSLIADYYEAAERRLLRESDAVVSISPDFERVMRDWGVDRARSVTIENWAPLDEMQPVAQNNPWSRRHGLAGKFVFLYSGTIGRKHNPGMLVQLADAFASQPEVAVAVVSEGPGADWLRQELRFKPRPNLRMFPLQPFELLPKVLSSASVLVALLGEESGEFSVPSKVLTYHCIGRPLLLAVPAGNLASRIVEQNSTGLVVPPARADEFIHAAGRLYADSTLRQQAGDNARGYALRQFDIRGIANRFSEVLARVLEPASDPSLAALAQALQPAPEPKPVVDPESIAAR